MAAPKFKLEKLELMDLVRLRDEIEKQLVARVSSERKGLESRIAELAKLVSRKNGVAILNGATPARPAKRASAPKRARVRPKYRGPNGMTWAGRGLPPKWLTALEKKGRKREEFLIEKRSNGQAK